MEHINEELDFLKSLIKGMANHFGESCETVLLDVSNPEEYGSGLIVAIENGQITGRKVGDTGTNLGLEVLSGKENDGDKHNYMTQTKDGKMLRSTTMYIRNDEGVPIGCICINLDITDLVMAENTIRQFTRTDDINTGVNEVFVNNVNDVLELLIQEAQDYVGKPVARMNKEEKMKGIHYLDRKGAFLIKKAGETICSYFSISKYTLYNYLEKSREND
ncbi:helix-turn-helix transcriptional regulator [Halobacillus salinarum]|uniref:Helix-turn-helix transcriptional regulator n=1 Tax=Halobacillus salinarum TaxID=2932257 RepID=A0ABY4EI86_9BACI|nr:helix-turn-helix transcriptional regulator [Halobacillus salinarum]UOQ44199.1 helix-turn-helix transcriptional regulator [Halobacillus salinarum]